MKDTGEFQVKARGPIVKQWNRLMDNLGALLPIELTDIPFEVKRIFAVTDCPAGEYRGGHAHRKTKQYVFCLMGKIRVLLINKAGSSEKLLHQGCGLLIEQMTWDKLQFLTGDDVLLVLCNTPYDPKDYIENFTDFEKMISDENNSGNDRAE